MAKTTKERIEELGERKVKAEEEERRAAAEEKKALVELALALGVEMKIAAVEEREKMLEGEKAEESAGIARRAVVKALREVEDLGLELGLGLGEFKFEVKK